MNRSQIVIGSRKKMEVLMSEDHNIVTVDNTEIWNYKGKKLARQALSKG